MFPIVFTASYGYGVYLGMIKSSQLPMATSKGGIGGFYPHKKS